MLKSLLMVGLIFLISACVAFKPLPVNQATLIGKVSAGMPAIDPNSSIYELPVKAGVNYHHICSCYKARLVRT